MPTSQAVLIYGLVSFIPSHAVVFVTAHQVYGDPFVLLVLGAFIGFAMSARRINAFQARAAARALASGVRPAAVVRGRPLRLRQRGPAAGSSR